MLFIRTDTGPVVEALDHRPLAGPAAVVVRPLDRFFVTAGESAGWGDRGERVSAVPQVLYLHVRARCQEKYGARNCGFHTL